MRQALGFLLLSLAACGDDRDRDPATVTVLSDATCEPTGNALRFRCSAAVEPTAPTTWTAVGEDGATRTFTTPTDAEPEVVMWGFPPETEVSWTVDADGASATGSFTTRALPSGLDTLDAVAVGEATVEGIGLVQTCGAASWLLIVDGQGRVVWYDRTEDGPPGGGGYDFTEVGTVVRSTADSVTEVAMDGTVLWTAAGFDRPLHHDVRRGGRHVYALNAGLHDGYVVDGVYVLTDGVLVAEWDLTDVITPGSTHAPGGFWQLEFPGATDWSHGNSVWSDGVSMMVSLRWQDLVLKLDGDPDSPGFGSVDWTLTGTWDSDFVSDFFWPEGGGYNGQHHATPVEGGVVMFDNRDFVETSRALVVSLDEAAGTAHERSEWVLDTQCEIQGSAFLLPGGGMLATCAPRGRVLEFGPTDTAPRFELAVSCGEQGPGGFGLAQVARGYPVDLP